MAVFQCASSATRWLVAAAAACLLGAGQVAGRSHSHRVARHGPPRPANRADDAGTTYFARHGLSPPPPIFRRELEGIADDGTQSFVDHNARLRHDLLRGHDEAFDFQFYDKHSYPWDYVWHNATSGGSGGVPVEANINFHSVASVDVVKSVMDLVVWVRLVWVDPRLRWDPADYGGLDRTWFWVGDGTGGETTEIWTPDIELWNAVEGLGASLEPTYAKVNPDGRVWWGRPGHLRPNCKFEGMDAFPFDRLSCAMEFGSWGLSGKYLQITKQNGVGYTDLDSETKGEGYAEYHLAAEDPITCKEHSYTYNAAPGDDWPGKGSAILYPCQCVLQKVQRRFASVPAKLMVTLSLGQDQNIFEKADA